ncbi:MAG: hypothetical protein ACHQIH_01485 [Ignavibacteria bacterium]
MKASDDLFQLIKAMSKSEKGYFKKFASKHTTGGGNIYLRLFDAIDDLRVYDENELKTKFKGEKFTDKIYSTKNYLFNLILKALSAYHSERFAVSKLSTMHIELNVLFDKGLYKQYKSRLNKAIELAKEHDKAFWLAHLYDKEIKLLVTEYYEGASPENFGLLRKKVLENLDNLKLDQEYEILYYELFFLLKKIGSVRNKKDLDALNKFIDTPLFKNEKLAKNFNSKFHIYSMLGHYYRAISDNGNWYKYRKALLDLMESDPKYIREYQTSYISSLNNYLNACVYIGKYREFEKYLDKMKAFSVQFANKKEYTDNQTRLFLLISDLELNYYKKTCRFEGMRKLIEDIEHGFKKFGKLIIENRKISLYNRIAYAYFIIRDYSKSIQYINLIMNATNPKVEQEQHSFARIRNLILHFELGNYDLLEYAVRSTRKYLSKAERIYKFEKLVLDFVVKAMNTDPEAGKLALYDRLKFDLGKIADDPFEKSALEQFDVISWLESKIQKKDFADILKSKDQ